MRSASTKPSACTACGWRTFRSCPSTPCMTRASSPTPANRASVMSRSSMAKLSDDQQRALAGLLGLGDQSARKSHYPELTARLHELEAERNRYIRLNDELELRVAARTDELLEANRNLQQQIAQREQVEQELRDARDAAEAANRSKDKYLAAASHDLLQPLNAVLDISRLDQAAVKPDVALYRLDELFAPLVSEFQSVALAFFLNFPAPT